MISAVAGGNWLRSATGFLAAQPASSRQNNNQAFLMFFSLSGLRVDGNLDGWSRLIEPNATILTPDAPLLTVLEKWLAEVLAL